LKDAVLEIMDLADPEQKVFLSEYQRVIIDKGVLPSTVEMIPAEKARQFIREFMQVSQNNLSDLTGGRFETKAETENEKTLEEEIHNRFLP
jgi:predicted nucleotidyltransferase